MKVLTLAFISLLTFPIVELEMRDLPDAKIELLVPKTFKVMTKELLGKKYPYVYINTEKQEAFVLTDDSATVYLAFNYDPRTEQISSESIILTKNAFKIGFQEAYPNANLIEDGIKYINRKRVGYIKFITQQGDKKTYNYFFLTDVRRKLLLCSFSCPEKLMPEWEETAEQIVNSLRAK